MKKIAIALAGICLSSAALADDSVRIINNERSANLTVTYQICTYTPPAGNTTCDPKSTTTVPIPSTFYMKPTEKNYVDVTLTNKDSFVHVLETRAEELGKTVAAGKYSDSVKICSISRTGDAAVLNSYGTDVVYCNDHNIGFAVLDNK